MAGEKKIVYVKAELIEAQERTALLKVLNGYGEPEIRAVAENVVVLQPLAAKTEEIVPESIRERQLENANKSLGRYAKTVDQLYKMSRANRRAIVREFGTIHPFIFNGADQ